MQRKAAKTSSHCGGLSGKFFFIFSLPLLHKHMQLVLSQRLFDWVCSLFGPFLNKVVTLLYPTGDDWANCSHGSRVYNDFGVQGEEALSSNGFPASSEETPSGLTVYPGGFLRRCRLASPTAPPFPFAIALHCSCAWSWAMAEKGRHVFCKTNPPFPLSWHMSRRYTDNHLA